MTDAALSEDLAGRETPGERQFFQSLARHCKAYAVADPMRSAVQIATTVVLYTAICAAMGAAVQAGYWLVYAALLLPAAGLLVRLFILQHDCGHGSLFRTRRVNDWVGRALSVATFTPYGYWRTLHNMHHAGSGNLDSRGYGSIDTMTVEEYRVMPPRGRILYRIYRNPAFLFLIAVPFFMIVGQRFSLVTPFIFHGMQKRLDKSLIRNSVIGTNIALAVFYGFLALMFGVWPVLLVVLPTVYLTAAIGGWLFFIQHQFEDTHWRREDEWNFQQAAVMGSSYYVLHPILQWFSGSIGLHHIHHLCALVPNYNLQKCLDASPALQKINRITLRESLKSAGLTLWDEEQKRLVSFAEAQVRPIPTSRPR